MMSAYPIKQNIIPKIIRLFSVLCLPVFCLLSCSGGIGFIAGTVVDETLQPKTGAKPWRLDSFEEGRGMVVRLNDGDKFKGKYAGLYNIDNELYSSEYSSFKSDSLLEIYIPLPGDTISILTITGTYTGNIFMGLGYCYGDRSKKITEKYRARCYYILAEFNGELKKYTLDQVHLIKNKDDEFIYGYTLMKLLEDDKLPLLTGAKFNTREGLKYIRYSEIRTIEYDKKIFKWLGLAIGIVYDVVSYKDYEISLGDWE